MAAYAVQLPSPVANKYRADLTREAQFVFGMTAPIAMLAGQIEQESGWQAGVTAWDNGRGLAQFMDPTASWVAERFAELGPADPYNPKWAIRAMVRLNQFNIERIYGVSDCEKWGGALKAYNAGLGYVLKAQKRSRQIGVWFGVTEFINAGQSQKNFEYSRQYPRWILLKRQPKYANWSTLMCKELQ
jgi:soluble lytic murein transglycosylase-like protein